MAARALAAIALRIWGVVFLVGALTSLPLAVSTFMTRPASQQPDWFAAQSLALLLNLGVRAIAGVILIAWADRIAAALVRDAGRVVIEADAGDLMALGLFLAGIFFLVWGLEDLAPIIYDTVTRPAWLATDSSLSYAWRSGPAPIVRASVGIVAGLVLIFRRGGLTRAWQGMRGRKADTEENDPE